MALRPCLTCGMPSEGARSEEHRLEDRRVRNRHRPKRFEAGWHWRKLSLRARRLQPFCIDCQTTEDLTGDHLLPGKVARTLRDVAVRCRSCNAKRGEPSWDEVPPVALPAEGGGDPGARRGSQAAGVVPRGVGSRG